MFAGLTHHLFGAPAPKGYVSMCECGPPSPLAANLPWFIDERTTLQKEEMNSKHAYDMLMQDLNAQIAQGEADRGSKAESKA
jgi:hypothetical protein